MSLNKETKIRILENFYSIDYVLFGKPLKNVELKEDCDVCNAALIEEYVATKGALLSTIIEMYKLIDHCPEVIQEKVNVKQLNEMAISSAKTARKNALSLLDTPRGKASIKDRLVESLTENKKVDLEEEVKTRIKEKAFSLAIDNLLVSRAISESTNYKELDSWTGKIIEDAYKILRDSLIETSLEVVSRDVKKN